MSESRDVYIVTRRHYSDDMQELGYQLSLEDERAWVIVAKDAYRLSAIEDSWYYNRDEVDT